LAVGDVAPEFEGRTAGGKQLRLSQLRGGPVVLYFFPKADSAGCTRESIGFAHYYPALRAQGVEVVGVSVDAVSDQRAFAERCSVPFPLVADAGKEIARSYGVLGVLGLAKRITFLLDRDGRVLEVVDSILPRPHVQRARDRWIPPPP
jgi:peroxiredoxin Q/BCP